MNPLRFIGTFIDNLFPQAAFEHLQFWLSLCVCVFGILQLDLDRKLAWPAGPGRLTIWGYWIGVQLASPGLAMRLGDAGSFLDKAATLLGRIGVAGLSVVALFAFVDSFFNTDGPRPMLTLMMMFVAPIQFRALTSTKNHRIVMLP